MWEGVPSVPMSLGAPPIPSLPEFSSLSSLVQSQCPNSAFSCLEVVLLSSWLMVELSLSLDGAG